LAESVIQVVIINDSRREECEAACGVDWSSSEVIALASQQIRDRFGEKMRVEYVDLAEATVSPETDEFMKIINNRSLSLPVLLINGQPRISGQFDIRQLLDAIEADMEMGVGK